MMRDRIGTMVQYERGRYGKERTEAVVIMGRDCDRSISECGSDAIPLVDQWG